MSDLTILDLMDRTVQRSRSSTAIALYDDKITYVELSRRCRHLAASIGALTTGDTVALYFPMCPEFIVSFFGVSYAKKCVLPLNFLLPPDDLKLILADSGARCIITSAEMVE